uniref:Uncharacterized protein n=1 Tax=Setaria italica TaxID=4555 RepID=K4AJ96_SETIT
MSNWGYLGDSQIFVQFTPKIKVASTRFSDYHFRNALAGCCTKIDLSRKLLVSLVVHFC